MARSAIHKMMRKMMDEAIRKEYLSRNELAQKYKINKQKVWRLIKDSGLPYDEEIQKIHEGEFLEWKKGNEHLLQNNQGRKNLKP